MTDIKLVFYCQCARSSEPVILPKAPVVLCGLVNSTGLYWQKFTMIGGAKLLKAENKLRDRKNNVSHASHTTDPQIYVEFCCSLFLSPNPRESLLSWMDRLRNKQPVNTKLQKF